MPPRAGERVEVFGAALVRIESFHAQLVPATPRRATAADYEHSDFPALCSRRMHKAMRERGEERGEGTAQNENISFLSPFMSTLIYALVTICSL